ncbi:MAG: hypothetical protein KAJ32_03045 [Gammaproteobacteria bacterium]|nr:hypothetical protein [Gammaproteobacteria bacterium]
MNSNKPELSKKAINKIETLCEKGCSQVNDLLKNAKNGNKLEELSDFNGSEIDQIVDELSQIMSVYDDDDNSL